MNREVFNRMVAALEEKARSNPRGYALRVGALACLGYAYILTVLVGMIVLLAAVVTLFFLEPNAATGKLAFVGGAIALGMGWAILKGLWVRLPTPTGVDLTPANAPGLFQLITSLQRELKAPRFHHVLLDGDFNASVTQVPRLGLLGWQRNYLVVGLPLLQTLSPEEFKAVLAHEFGHLSASHSRFSGWIYRMRLTWQRVVAQLEARQQRGAFLLTKFLGWFWPKFNAHAFVLSRVNEYVADACAVRFAGAAAAASALLRVNQTAAQLGEDFWPGVFKSARTTPAPPENIFDRLAAAVRQPPPPDRTARWLRAAFLAPTGTADTHPSLSDRLHAMGELPAGAAQGRFPERVPPFPGPNAAIHCLAPYVQDLTTVLNLQWRAGVEEDWRGRHRETSELAAELAKAPPDVLVTGDPEALWRLATIALRLDGDAAALPYVNRLLELEANHAGANFIRGRHELSQDHTEGVRFLERAMKADQDSVPAASELLAAFFSRTGRREDLHRLETFLDGHDHLVEEAQKERADVTVKDRLAPHELTDAQREHIAALAAAEPDIRAVHAARKVVRHLPDSPFFVLALKLDVAWWKPRRIEASTLLVRRFLDKLQLPGHSIVFTIEEKLKALGRHVQAVPVSLVYTKRR